MNTEPLGPWTSNKKIVPHIPYYMTGGNTVWRKWREIFIDRCGNMAWITKVEYKNKDGKLNEAVVQVQWLEK